jgi:hypothetical protein
LRRPSQQDLRRANTQPTRSALDNGCVKEQRDILRPLVECRGELQEALWTEGGVRGDRDVVLLGHLDELGLNEIGVVFDLEGGYRVPRVGLHVVEELGGSVRDADGFGNARVDNFLENEATSPIHVAQLHLGAEDLHV